MDIRLMGSSIFSTLHNMLDDSDKSANGSVPIGTYMRDARAMAATSVDIQEEGSAYVFVIDMPGVKSGDIKVQVDDENVLLIAGEGKREDEEGVKYLRMERRVGKFMRKFQLPDNANVDKISVVCVRMGC